MGRALVRNAELLHAAIDKSTIAANKKNYCHFLQGQWANFKNFCEFFILFGKNSSM